MPWRCFDFVVNMICIVWGAKKATQAFNINNSTDSFYCYNPYFMFHDYLFVLVVDLYPFLPEKYRKNERKKELNSEKKIWSENITSANNRSCNLKMSLRVGARKKEDRINKHSRMEHVLVSGVTIMCMLFVTPGPFE